MVATNAAAEARSVLEPAAGSSTAVRHLLSLSPGTEALSLTLFSCPVHYSLLIDLPRLVSTLLERVGMVTAIS